MEKASTDVLYSIFQELWLSDRPSVLKATLVCKIWHQIAQRILEGDIDQLILSPGSHARNLRLFQRIEHDSRFQQRLHRICVLDVYCSGFLPIHRIEPFPDFRFEGHIRGEYGHLERRSDSTWAQLNQLAALIPKLSLSSFVWAAKPRIPECILDALRIHPNCRVHLQLRAGDPEDRNSYDITFPSIQTLEGLSSLRFITSSLVSLGVVVPAWDDVSNERSILRMLGKLISESPLRSLQIHAAGRIYPRNTGTSYDGDGFATVTDFRWMSDVFDRARGPLRLKRLRLTNMCMCGPEHALFHLGKTQLGTCISWKDLRDVHFTCPSLLSIVVAENAQLQSLKLRLDTSYPEVESKSCRRQPDFDVIRSLLFSHHKLEHLELYNGLPVMASGDEETDKDLFSHLGQSLQSLTLHENEPGGYSAQHPRSIISSVSLMLLGESCPYLRDLAIDIPWKDSELLEYLDCISKSLWFVRDLNLLMELEKFNQHKFREPVSDRRCVQIWNDLCTSSSRLRLEKLIISVGAMFSNEKSNPRQSMEHWQRRFLVKEDGTSGEKGHAVATCLELEEFKGQLRHDPNATYGIMTHTYLPAFKDIAVDGCHSWHAPQRKPSPSLPGMQHPCYNTPPIPHPLFTPTRSSFSAPPPRTQHHRVSRKTKLQRKPRTLLPKERV